MEDKDKFVYETDYLASIHFPKKEDNSKEDAKKEASKKATNLKSKKK